MLIFGHFSKFVLICECYFWQISPPLPKYMFQKNALNHFLVHSSAKKNSLSSAKNVLFSLFCILVHRPMGGGSSLSLWLRYWKTQWLLPYKATFTLDCALWSVLQLPENYSTLILWSIYAVIRHQRYENIYLFYHSKIHQ